MFETPKPTNLQPAEQTGPICSNGGFELDFPVLANHFWGSPISEGGSILKKCEEIYMAFFQLVNVHILP